MLVRMISCNGATGEARAKNCTDDDGHNGEVVEGEMVPCCHCRVMRTQLEHMREELDRMVNWLGLGLGHSGLVRRLEGSIDVGLGQVLLLAQWS